MPPWGCSSHLFAVFDALRWAERQAEHGGRCVLLPNVTAQTGARGRSPSAAAAEHAPALADRLFRAASGRSAHLAPDGDNVVVGSD